MGVMPLVIGIPMPCRDAVDRKRTLFKHKLVKLVGWKLRPEDTSVVEASTDAEYVLAGYPLSLYVDARTRMNLRTEDTTAEVVEVMQKTIMEPRC